MYRYPMMRPRPMAQQPQDAPRNFGTDLHALLSGMSRIVQLLFTGIPVISFVGTIVRYLWKFIGYLGHSAARALPAVEKGWIEGEAIWAETELSWNRVKIAAVFAVALLGVRILLRKRQIKAEDTWDSPSSSEEEYEQVKEQPLPYGINSEESRITQQSPQQFEEAGYPDDFWDQYS